MLAAQVKADGTLQGQLRYTDETEVHLASRARPGLDEEPLQVDVGRGHVSEEGARAEADVDLRDDLEHEVAAVANRPGAAPRG